MTSNEVDQEIGRAVREYSENEKRIACLKRRLQRFSTALSTALEPAYRILGEGAPDIEEAPDPRADYAALRECLQTQEQLREVFRKHGVSLP